MNDPIRSRRLFAEAQTVLPGGVDSPVRAFRSVGGEPLFIDHGEGPYLYDVDGNRYIDYVLSWGPLILGHAHPEVVAALAEAAARGTSYGAPCEQEVELARRICDGVPSIEMIRFVNSGTEATMSALRLARAFTGREKIVKFAGCYHGHADPLLVKAGSGVATLSLPDSPGVPPGTARDTLVARFNDLDSVRQIFEAHRGQIAAVIVEPVAGNMGVVPPETGFLGGLREITHLEGALLILDEVMTGFRVHPAGAQALYGVAPDLTTLGKVIGGGLPIGAYGGRREIMEMIAPSGPVYQAGTLSGNPLAMMAGLKTLEVLGRPGVWASIEQSAAALEQGFRQAAAEAGVRLQCVRVGTMMTAFFHSEPPRDWDSASQCDTARFGGFFHSMLHEGIYLPPSQFEAFFLSTAHNSAVQEQTLAAACRAFHRLSV